MSFLFFLASNLDLFMKFLNNIMEIIFPFDNCLDKFEIAKIGHDFRLFIF